MSDETKKRHLHAFVICAYKESGYLEDCIRSLKNQSRKSHICMVTSTDNAFIRGLADKYDIPLSINHGKAGIAGDWNFGIDTANALFTTIAHQDDIYERDYAKCVMAAVNKNRRRNRGYLPQIIFTDYSEIKDGKKSASSPLIAAKRLLLTPFYLKNSIASPAVKKTVLSLGNAICCPSVTYCTDMVRSDVSSPVFDSAYASNLDWEKWTQLAAEPGAFLYVPKRLMAHRIHEGSETSKLIEDNGRGQEDDEMFYRTWPAPVAALLSRIYRVGQRFNRS